MDTKVIVYADKTILTIKGIKVSGLKPVELEKQLSGKLQTVVRIIGVTGSSIEMDVYNLEQDAVRRNENGIIQIVSVIEGVSASEFARIEYNNKSTEVDVNDIPPKIDKGCAKERWC
jgi:hypothetical protein